MAEGPWLAGPWTRDFVGLSPGLWEAKAIVSLDLQMRNHCGFLLTLHTVPLLIRS